MMNFFTCHSDALGACCPPVRTLDGHLPLLISGTTIFIRRGRQVSVVMNLNGVCAILWREVN